MTYGKEFNPSNVLLIEVISESYLNYIHK